MVGLLALVACAVLAGPTSLLAVGEWITDARAANYLVGHAGTSAPSVAAAQPGPQKKSHSSSRGREPPCGATTKVIVIVEMRPGLGCCQAGADVPA
ncbi:hypothetical protein ACIBL8_48065 [Streptomyces sp. NPDC050523]|uniref:hypothetical protein n=1 Tax=Streptomyces sp. NPDC050523 TaxID=3365622 RepID=UPI0037AC9534